MNPRTVSIPSLLSTKRKVQGTFTPPPDKSITHRAIFLAALSAAESKISNPLLSGDCLSTLRCFRRLGVTIRAGRDELFISKGNSSPHSLLRALKKPHSSLYCGNSGTTMRLLAGVLSAQPFSSRLTGDPSLSRRPMKRVIEPLIKMGAKITGRNNGCPPLLIQGNPHLKAIGWKSPVASAQVKSSILLAGLFAEGETSVQEPVPSRDHTERMLKKLGAKINFKLNPPAHSKNIVTLNGGGELRGLDITIPGDFSSAAFFIAATLMVPGSKLIIRNVNLNPTRTGLLNVLKRMGANIKITGLKNAALEPLGNLQVEHSSLKGASISKEEIPFLIDELPVFSVLATQAKGKTAVDGAGELRFKESDRLSAMASELKKMGAGIEEQKNGWIIEGPIRLRGAKVKSYGDHRVAMSLAVAALAAEGDTAVQGFDCIAISFPEFLKQMKRLWA